MVLFLYTMVDKIGWANVEPIIKSSSMVVGTQKA